MHSTRSRPPARPAVRLRPVPPLDPPFDDECTPGVWFGRPGDVDPAGATGRAGHNSRPAPHPRRQRAPVAVPPPRTAVASTGPQKLAPGTGWSSSVQSLAGASVEARQAAKSFLDLCLEIVNGYRPAGHIRSRCSPADAGRVIEKLASAAARIPGRRRPGQPARTVRLRRLRVCEPRPGVVEAAAVVTAAGRTWALAFRVEQRQGRWVGISAELL